MVCHAMVVHGGWGIMYPRQDVPHAAMTDALSMVVGPRVQGGVLSPKFGSDPGSEFGSPRRIIRALAFFTFAARTVHARQRAHSV